MELGCFSALRLPTGSDSSRKMLFPLLKINIRQTLLRTEFYGTVSELNEAEVLFVSLYEIIFITVCHRPVHDHV